MIKNIKIIIMLELYKYFHRLTIFLKLKLSSVLFEKTRLFEIKIILICTTGNQIFL